MKLEILKKDNNDLLERVEVSGSITFDKETPSNADVAGVIAKELGKDASLVVVKQIYTKFGQQYADFVAFVYASQEAKGRAEKVTKHLRKQAEVAAKKAEEENKAAEEAKEKPVEEEPAKEESPEEVKEEPKAEEVPAEEAPKEEETKAEEPVKEELSEETKEEKSE